MNDNDNRRAPRQRMPHGGGILLALAAALIVYALLWLIFG